MNRRKTLTSFEPLGDDSQLSSIFAAMVFCLEPAEACELLDINFRQEYKKRRAIMKKIAWDMESSYLECHDYLIDVLMENIENLPHSKRQSCGSCLAQLSANAPNPKQTEVNAYFLASRWKHLRDRGYQHLLRNWTNSWRSSVEQSWQTWKDFGAARLIVEYFPEQYVIKHWDDLLHVMAGSYFLRRLYLRVASADQSKLENLRTSDSITYAYVLTKLNKKLTDKEALQIFRENMSDDRIGLLVWCFGRMRLWSVLEHVYSQIEDIRQARYLAITNKQFGSESALP